MMKKKAFTKMMLGWITAMLTMSIAVPVLAQEQPLTWTGEGTTESPYQISSQEHLAAIPTQGVDKCYKLTTGITLSGDWEPICNEKAPFTGTFDGNGYCISGLKISMDRSDHKYVGLFGYIQLGGVVKNLAVTGTVVASGSSTYAGGIAGINKGTIQNCYTDVDVTAPAAGGIAGSNNNTGTITSCYTVGDNTSNTTYYAGGIAGDNNKTIEKCYATGAVNAPSAGGIVGKNGSGSSITNCIALNSSITGTNIRRIGNETATYTGNYASPAIAGTWSNTGADKEDGTDLDAANFTNVKDASGAFTGWPTGDDGWDLTTANLPTLKNFQAAQPVASITRASVMTKPLLTSIATASDLATFRDAVNGGETYKGKTVTLTANITVDGWDTSIQNFTGTFNGDGYVITLTNATVSLFETINAGGIVKNLGVNATISAGDKKAGGIAETNKGTIQRCYAEGTITGTAGYIGGIADNEGTIEDCYSTVSITTTGYYAGGIAGGNFNGTIRRCYATGAISSKGSAGIAGASVSTNSIQDCIALNESIGGTGARARIVNSTNSTTTLAGNYASPAIAGTWNKIGADKNDGTDLTNANFIGQGAGEGAFTSWGSDIWEFGDKNNLPTLKGFKGTQSVAGTTRKSVMPAITSIATPADLEAFRKAVNGGESYEGKTVTLTASFTVDGWATGIEGFTGTFDGGGYVITMTNATTSLFNTINEGGTVKNLGVNATIENYTGSFGGMAILNKGTIQQCYTVGSITGSYGGGIVGQNEGAIRDCYSTVSIEALQGAGGIAQVNRSSGIIGQCYATGAISGGSESGGIAGNGYSGSITNCIALNTSIEGDGDLGRITGSNTGTLTTNYASPAIPGTWSNNEAAKKDGADLDDNNFTGKGANEGAFAGWSGDNWEFGDKTKLPALKGFKADQPVKDSTRAEILPIQTIATAADLAEFRDAVNSGTTYKDKTVTLTADITLSGDWTPIGNATNKFNGTFKGGGHCISGLSVTINKEGGQYGGLFGYIDEKGIVQNLGVKGTASVTSTNTVAHVGGITGCNNGTIQHCYTDVAVTASAAGVANAGGIAGQNNNKISYCYTRGNSTATTNAGGIAGSNEKSIEQCYATGAVNGGSAGGIVGFSDSYSSHTKCIALNSSITGSPWSGRISSNDLGTFADNYASPAIAGTWNDKGTGKRNGADLGEENFIDTGANKGSFTGWLPAIWDFTDATKLPALKTTGLTPNIVIAGQDPMPTRADLLEKIIKIETAVTYDAATHKDQSIRVLDNGIFTVNADGASLKKLTIDEGGQVVATKAFQCGKLLAPRTLGNRWTAYSSPVAMKAVAKEETEFYTKTGYATAQAQSWGTLENNTATSRSLTSPTLVAVEGDDVAVTLTATPAEGSTSLTIPAEGTATTGSALSTGIFLFCQNPTLKNITIPVAYILSTDGTRFERTTNAVVKPFQAYMVANAATSNAVMSLRTSDTPTANEQIATSDFRIWGNNGQLHLSADRASRVSIYTVTGQLVRTFTLTGEQTLTLGSGIYFVHSNNITYKVSL